MDSIGGVQEVNEEKVYSGKAYIGASSVSNGQFAFEDTQGLLAIYIPHASGLIPYYMFIIHIEFPENISRSKRYLTKCFKKWYKSN